MSEYIICVFGSGGVGKSCLTIQFVQNVFIEKYDPTIEDVYKKTIEIDLKEYSLEILDTAGSNEFSSMRDIYVRDAHGYVLVYSITSPATFNDIQAYYNQIIKVKDIDTHGTPAIVLVGNKTDLKTERKVSREDGQELARKWNCTFLETSAKDRSNVTEIFYDLVRQINRKQEKFGKNQSISQPPGQSEPHVKINQGYSTSQSNEQKDKKLCPSCVLL